MTITDVLVPTLPPRVAAMARRLAATPLADLDPRTLAELDTVHERARTGPDTEENRLLRLLTRQFSTRTAIPDYYRYTGMHVYDWFLSRREDVFGGCVLALHGALLELARVERTAARRPSAPEHVLERLRRLGPLTDQVLDLPLAPDGLARARDLAESGVDDARLGHDLLVLAACTGHRRSDKHDEHVFLSAVYVCEIVFFLIRWSARQAVDSTVDRRVCRFHLDRATACAELLSATFHVLKTLSPAMFLSFRDATGDASAVQSLNYHLMEQVLYGYDDRKAPIYQRLAHLRPLAEAPLRDFASLRSVITATGDDVLTEAYGRLDRTLLTWRGRHYGFGRTYLPDMEGSGGTEGASYLKMHIHKDGLGSGDRVIDPASALSRFAFS
ncbi:tryptophan 2,3-dioxygenase family protein [Actinokineospora guangxiensis]|uniref:Tryptophan 2,3-dioxygenase family protein n=1 Tax=Actinokineospora guangxiensis TaxID=1490288 RepID=A0ABW0EI73_9PSEU